MPEPEARRPISTPRRLLVLALAGAALAIAVSFWVGNAAMVKAMGCEPQLAAAKAVDDAAVGQLAALNGTGTGRAYSDMKFTDADGKPVTLAAFAGKTLLVNFWASWCIPCRAEMPELERVAEKFNDDGFMVLPINLDLGAGGLDKARKFLADGGWKHLPLYADPTFEAFKRLQVEAVATGLPTTLLIDRKGCEIGVLQGPAVWDSPDGANVINALKKL